ncbi:MAG: pantoate--beta-alanine ligase [Deltaproteobacteria bacterium]|nr:pantoate--beta-alanine ligase [Deltaproteobacteria bacterium]
MVRDVASLRRWVEAERSAGRRVALVPTMGALHEGHLSLVRIARQRADSVVVSIFVNPAQFGPGEDFDQYPRDLDGDAGLLAEEGVDVVFAPSAADMYPEGDATRVRVERLTEGLCGRSRPGHFEGVTTVVARLFNAVRPHVAVFGEKDYQQLAAIRRMARDLLFDVEVVGGPTVREADGLAMSSRNAYLAPAARLQATALQDALGEARRRVASGETDARGLLEAVRRRIAKEPLAELDYAELRDADSLESVDRVGRRSVLALAVRFEGARLIDNTVLETP